MIRTVRMMNALLTAHERRRAIQVFVLMLLMALVEALGIVSIMPFVAVLANAEIVTKNYYLSAVYNYFGFTNPDIFLIFLGLGTLSVFLTGLVLKAATVYASLRYTNMRTHSLTCRLLAAYLRQPYAFFLGRNTADLGKTVLSEVGRVTNGVLLPMLRVLSGMVVAITILFMLVWIEPFLSLAVAVVLGGAFAIVYLSTRRLLHVIGKERVKANELRFVLANEALNGVKELRLMGRVDAYLARFWRPSERYARHQATSKTIGELPQFGIQAIVFGGALFSVLFLTAQRGGLDEALPYISLYALAGYRLMPAFQVVFNNLTRIRFALPTLELLHNDLTDKEDQALLDGEQRDVSQRLNGTIRLNGVTYQYPGMERSAVRDLNLEISRGTSVAFVGSTGAGKSTVVDLILGLLQPTQGQIVVDDQQLRGASLRNWQMNIGYVPQATYLADDSVAANIAFGIPYKKIDKSAVERAARAAQIHEFVVADLADGYDTIVGERGIRLSGGQRQRLAIARALYHDPEVVVFDEATSALDNATEAVVMEAIEALRGAKTVIIIAHRFSTIEQCDHIFLLKDGELLADGTYGGLLESSAHFKKLVRATSA